MAQPVEVDAKAMCARLTTGKEEKGLPLGERRASVMPGDQVSAEGLSQCASDLNYLEWLVPGGFCHLRSRWDHAVSYRVMEMSGAGDGRQP